MSTTTKKPQGQGGAGIGFKNVASAPANQISMAHIDPPVFSSAVADPTNAEWKTRYGVSTKVGDVYYQSNASYAPKVCTVADATTPTWAAIGSAAALDLQGAFANGKAITGADSSANAVKIGNGTDDIYIFRNAANDCRITTVSGSDLTIAPADDLVLAPTGEDTTITGTLAVSSTLTAQAALAVTGAATLSGGCAVTGDLSATGNITGTLAVATWSANPTITVSATLGDGVTVEGGSVTTGNILKLHADASLTSGNFINCMDIAASKFAVAEDGAITIAGTATGTDAIAVTAGDLTLTSGDLTLTNGDLVLTSGGLTFTGDLAVTGEVDITADSAHDAIDLVPNAGAAAIDLNLPATANLAGGYIDIDASTGSGPVMEMAFSGAYTGDAVSLIMTNAVGAKAIDITGAGTRTAALVHLTDVPTTSAPTLDIDITTQHNSGHVIDIDLAATSTHSCNIIDFATAAAYTGDVINILMTNAGAGAQVLVATSVANYTSPMVNLTSAGAAGGNAIYIDSTATNATGHCLNIKETGTSTNNLINLAYAGAHTGDAIGILMTNAAAGAQGIVFTSAVAHTSPNVSLTSANGAAATLYMSNGSTDAAGHGVSILQHGAGANNAINLAFDAASTGDAIAVVMTNAAATAQALTVTSAVAATNPTVALTTANGAAATLYISNASTDAAGHGISVLQHGVGTSNAIAVAYDVLATGDAVNIAMAGAAAASQALVITSNVAHSGNIVSVAATGSLAGGTGKICSLSYATGTLASATSGFVLDISDTSAATGTSYAVNIASTSNEALNVSAGYANFAEAIRTAGVTSTGVVTTTNGIASGTAKTVGGRMNTAAISAALTNTADETAFSTGSVTIPANTLLAGSVTKIKYAVRATATNAADTLGVKLYFGAAGTTGDTLLVTHTAADATDNDIVYGEFTLNSNAAPSADSAVVGAGIFSELAAAGGALKTAHLASTNFATTGALYVKVWGKWSAASASNSCVLEFLTVEIV